MKSTAVGDMEVVNFSPDSVPGSGLSSHPHQEAADAYLQDRLLIFYRVSAVAVLGFLLIMEAVDAVLGAWSVESSLLDPSQVGQVVATVGTGALYVVLRVRTFHRRALRVLDAAGLFLVMAAALNMYCFSYEEGLSPLILGVLCIFVIARAIVVPSSARRTLLLSLPAPLAVLFINLVRGPPAFASTDPQVDAYVAWHQAVMLFATVVATIASRVTFHLRNRVAEAQRLGEYRIEAQIGEGGMGKVYRATHAMLRRPTAIKILDPDIAAPRTLHRFEREVQLTSRLGHPNNVQVYDYGTTADGLFYYAMEFLDGMDLLEVLEADGPLPPGRVIHALRQVCAALGEAHDLGLVHRDVKPANIMLCRRGGECDVVKVLDYGIAKDLRAQDTSASQQLTIAGTPDYMAPEVISGQGAGPLSDLYSLGATAYHALTGWRVFGAKALADQLGHHLRTEPIPPSRRLDTVPADLEAVILRCLAKNPEDRYRGVRALWAALDHCEHAGTWTPAHADAWWQARGSNHAAPAS